MNKKLKIALLGAGIVYLLLPKTMVYFQGQKLGRLIEFLNPLNQDGLQVAYFDKETGRTKVAGSSNKNDFTFKKF